MIEFVHIDKVQEGAILGKDIVNYKGGYDLKKKGTTLTTDNIKQLKAQGYHYILITDQVQQSNEFHFLNQLSAYRNNMVNKFVTKFKGIIIDERKYNDLQIDELLKYKNDRISKTYFEKIAQDTIPNEFIINLYKEIDTIYDLIDNEDDIKINLTENRNQSVCIFGHMIDCGIYYMAVAIKMQRQKGIPPKIEHKNAILRGALGAMLHDIGYLHKKLDDIHNEIIHKNKLSNEYDSRLYKHIIVSSNIIGALSTPYISEAKVMCREHHCYLNKSGIPKDTAPSSPASKILSVIDTYDILSNEWFGRRNYNRQSVIQYLQKNKGTLFDPMIVETFLDILRPYTEDEKLILCNKKNEPMFYAAVTKYNIKQRLPEIRIYQTADGKKVDPQQVKNLSEYPNIIVGELSDYNILN